MASNDNCVISHISSQLEKTDIADKHVVQMETTGGATGNELNATEHDVRPKITNTAVRRHKKPLKAGANFNYTELMRQAQGRPVSGHTKNRKTSGDNYQNINKGNSKALRVAVKDEFDIDLADEEYVEKHQVFDTDSAEEASDSAPNKKVEVVNKKKKKKKQAKGERQYKQFTKDSADSSGYQHGSTDSQKSECVDQDGGTLSPRNSSGNPIRSGKKGYVRVFRRSEPPRPIVSQTEVDNAVEHLTTLAITTCSDGTRYVAEMDGYVAQNYASVATESHPKTKRGKRGGKKKDTSSREIHDVDGVIDMNMALAEGHRRVHGRQGEAASVDIDGDYSYSGVYEDYMVTGDAQTSTRPRSQRKHSHSAEGQSVEGKTKREPERRNKKEDKQPCHPHQETNSEQGRMSPSANQGRRSIQAKVQGQKSRDQNKGQGKQMHTSHQLHDQEGKYNHTHHQRRQGRESQPHGQMHPGGDNLGSVPEQRHDNRNPKKRPNKKREQTNFEPYWSAEAVSNGLKRGTLIQGPIRVNPRKYTEAYVPLPDGTSDIFITNWANRNRALNGDIVVVEILGREHWRVYTDDLDIYEANVKGQGDDERPAAADGVDSGPDVIVEGVKRTPGKNQHTPRKSYTSVNDVITSGSPIAKSLFQPGPSGDNEKTVRGLTQKTGKVVALLESKHSRACTGHLKMMQDKNPDIALFCPTDSRVPRIHVPMAECPDDFYERPEDYQKTLFIARITDWDEKSTFAQGNLARSIGEAGQIEPETEALLIEHSVDDEEFSQHVLKCLPEQLPWSIPDKEFSYRRDLRKQCIFSIDPSTARDLDDAVSVEELGNDMYEVGVHIADVSFFIEEGNPLDMKAASRATSVYLVQKVVPMLPRLLCEELCSLNPDEDRLTFSVVWKMNGQGEIEDEWFGRSVIRSCVKLSYQHAQGFIENPNKNWDVEQLPAISDNFSVDDIKKRVLTLDKIAKILRKKRFDSGALRLDQIKLTFSLDKDTGMPNGYSIYEQKDSNMLIEEFMLLANMAVAHKIYKTYSSKAVLRRHPPPQDKMVDDLRDTLHQLGIPLDPTNSKTWQESLSQLRTRADFTPAMMQVVVALCSRPMQNAKYFCSGMIADPEVYRHYALNVPLYTHFTSPIRRYADVMVHRLLAAALGYSDLTPLNHQSLQKQADHCNDKKYMAKRAGEMSSELFFAAFIQEMGCLEEKAMVMGLMDHSVDVFILKFGVAKRVYCDQLNLATTSYQRDHKQPILTLVWRSDDDQTEGTKQVLKLFSSVTVIMKGDAKEPLRWKAFLKKPETSS